VSPALVVLLLGALPWVALAVFMAVALRLPRPLPPAPGPAQDPDPAHRPGSLPPVTVIIPARNEAANIGRSAGSLARQDYPDFRILVVDDGSTDDTGAIARAIPPGKARELRVVEGRTLPDGWFGKPWACATGVEAAGALAPGSLLLFTDADTEHAPDLLLRAVLALEEDGADALSLLGRQEMGSFGERLVQPHIFALLGLRYRRLDRVIGPDRWKDAIANGQYILVRREAYGAMGGHEAVRGEVVEDLRLAQLLTEGGGRFTMRGAEDAFSTRMYTSLRDLVNGWTKNVATGARQGAVGWEGLALPGLLVFLLGVWVLPPLVLVATVAAALAAGGSIGPAVLAASPLAAWALLVTVLSFLLWIGGYARMGAPARYALLYPLGALVTAWIVVRSWVRGSRRIEWKGRRYASGGDAAASGGGGGAGAGAGAPELP
jgi:chlorobactene glucosyltransferase